MFVSIMSLSVFFFTYLWVRPDAIQLEDTNQRFLGMSDCFVDPTYTTVIGDLDNYTNTVPGALSTTLSVLFWGYLARTILGLTILGWRIKYIRDSSL